MQIFSFRNNLIIAALFISGTVFSQDLGSETVEVIKAYTPSVNDAFKIKETPSINDSISLEKKPVTYSIFSVPVASTFMPAKGRATDLERSKPPKIYDNYATLGLGNYTSVLGEFYSNLEVNRTDNFGIFFTHNSSQGGIDGVEVADKFYDTELNLNYTSRGRDLHWNTDFGVEHMLVNWFGVPDDFVVPEGPILGLQQNYYSVYANGELNFLDSFFERAAAGYRFFGDSHSSAEHRFTFKPTMELPIGGEIFNTNIIVDYVGGSFDRNYLTATGIDYSFLNLGLDASLLVLRDDLSLNLGAAVYYSMDSENSDSGVYIYPQVTASYRMAGEYFIAYAGLEGALEQNSYYDFVEGNPYVSPTLFVAPTDKQYDAYLGAKGKLSNALSYDLRASYKVEDFKPLYRSNPYGLINNNEDYASGNSFAVVYDKVKTISGFGELSFDVNRDFNLRVNGEVFSYNTDQEAEAWYLPNFKASLLADYQIGENWYAGANFFFVGERKDFLVEWVDGVVDNTPFNNPQVVSLDSYVDLNANLGYRFNDQLSAFVKGANLLGNNYERWHNFPVLGLQVMAGVTYKFDFGR